jgi:hypothetical protein
MRRHRRLLNLIDHLPADSAFVEAMTNDPDIAERVARGEIQVAEPDPDTPKGPRISEWSPQMGMFAEMLDRLATLITVSMVQAGAKKPPKIPPAPRPVTAIDAAAREYRKRANQENALAIIRALAPHEADHM